MERSKIKAIFFVSSFEGDRDHEPVRFYHSGPSPKLIWAEVAFHDGEIVEGFVQNSLHHLLGDGFFLTPSSPGGNNRLIYVNKAAIASYRVLGVHMEEWVEAEPVEGQHNYRLEAAAIWARFLAAGKNNALHLAPLVS